MKRDDVAAVIAAHFEMRQGLEPQDIYKLLYQGVLGPEHLMDDVWAAKKSLYLEVVRLPEALAIQPILEPLSPALCRVNLQPFIQGGGRVDIVWWLFRQTARNYRPGTLIDLERSWRYFLATPWASLYAPEILVQFWQRMATAGFPPVHHSRSYTEANAPHYRVVMRHLVAGQPGLQAQSCPS
jgi:hypothetical protein